MPKLTAELTAECIDRDFVRYGYWALAFDRALAH